MSQKQAPSGEQNAIKSPLQSFNYDKRLGNGSRFPLIQLKQAIDSGSRGSDTVGKIDWLNLRSTDLYSVPGPSPLDMVTQFPLSTVITDKLCCFSNAVKKMTLPEQTRK